MAWRFSFFDLLQTFLRAKPPAVMHEPAIEKEAAFAIEWVDLREVKRTKSRGRRKGTRAWDKVTGLTIHQTAVVITEPLRCLNIPVHGCILDDGHGGAIIVLLHDPTDYLWHGHGFNRRDIGIEVACRAAGVEGQAKTLWLPKKFRGLTGADRLAEGTEATEAQLEGARILTRYYRDLVAENGGELQFIHAHRQSTKNRVSDPGSRIWAACGEWARAELGLAVGAPDFAIGSGKPLPDAWTNRPNGVRYGWNFDGRISEE